MKWMSLICLGIFVLDSQAQDEANQYNDCVREIKIAETKTLASENLSDKAAYESRLSECRAMISKDRENSMFGNKGYQVICWD